MTTIQLDFSVKLCRFLLPDTWRRHQLTLADINSIINQADVRSLWILGVYFNIRVVSSSAKLANNDDHAIIFSAKCMLIKRLMQEITAAAEVLGITADTSAPPRMSNAGISAPIYTISHICTPAKINMLRAVPCDNDILDLTFADGTKGYVIPAWNTDGGIAAYVLNPAKHENKGFIKLQTYIDGKLYDISCEIVILMMTDARSSMLIVGEK